MYRDHWGLREAPFRGSLDPRSFYQTPNAEEALARLHFLVEEHRRVGVCFGPAGGGKSMLLEFLARELRRQGNQVANLSLLGADLQEFLWLLAAELGGNPRRDDSEFHLWRSIFDRLAINRLQQLDTVILLDDEDEAEPSVADAIARLADADRSADSRLTIVATAMTGNAHRLGNRLADLVELRIDLEPWEQADTVGFILAALRQAGRREPVFSDEAIVRLHELCDGIPRRICQLANLSLLAGAGQQAGPIEAETVESAFHELAAVEVSV
jgi:type II secretory pathway predicted ATPase ExeA